MWTNTWVYGPDSTADNITNMNSFEWSIYRIMDQSIWTIGLWPWSIYILWSIILYMDLQTCSYWPYRYILFIGLMLPPFHKMSRRLNWREENNMSDNGDESVVKTSCILVSILQLILWSRSWWQIRNLIVKDLNAFIFKIYLILMDFIITYGSWCLV